MSYGHTWIAERDTTVALVPPGYADGVFRALTGRLDVLVNGRRAAMSAASAWISSSLISVRARRRRGRRRRDPVRSGRDGEPTAQDWADLLGTINYEVVTEPAGPGRQYLPRGRRIVADDGRGPDPAPAGRDGAGWRAWLGCRRSAVARGVGRALADPARDGRRPYAGEDFSLLDADRGCVVTTPDGVDLAVREVGPVEAAVTVVFAHGFCMNMGAFHFQRSRTRASVGRPGPDGVLRPARARQVRHRRTAHLYRRATRLRPRHGAHRDGSARFGDPGRAFDGGYDGAVARPAFPRRYGTSIVGAAIISSAAEGLSRSPLGEILQNPALEAARLATRYAPNLVHRGRGAVRSVLSPILQAASFGDRAVSPTVARYSEHMIHDTPVTTMVGFLHALGVHDETDGLPVLAKVPTLIACGSADTLTLPEHSEEMAAVLPKAELLVVGGAGHLVQLEQPDPIDDALVRLVERATPNKLQALSRRVRERVRPLARSETTDLSSRRSAEERGARSETTDRG